MNVTYLYGQLEVAEEIIETRLKIWNQYNMGIEPLKREEGASQLPFIPNQSEHNVHIFYIKTKDLAE